MNRLSIIEVLREVWQLADARDLTMSVHAGDRNVESRGMRYIVKRAGEPLCCVKRLPISGPYDIQSLLATQKAYQSLEVVKAPQVLGWTQDDQSFFIVEQFVKHGVRLDEAVGRGMISWADAKELVATIFREVYSRPVGVVDAKLDQKRVMKAVEGSVLSGRQKTAMCRRVFDALPPMWHAPVWTNRDFMPQNVLLSDGQTYLVDFDLSCKTGLLGIDLMRVEFYTEWEIPFWPAEGARREDPLTRLLFLVLEQNLQAVVSAGGNYQRWLERFGPRITSLAEELFGSAGEIAKPVAAEKQRGNGHQASTPGSGRWRVAENVQEMAWGLKQRLKLSAARLAKVRPGLGALVRDAREGMIGRGSEWQSVGNNEFTFWVESSGQWSVPEKLALVSGWCFSKAGAIDAIRAVVNGTVCEGFYGGERPDVLAKMGEQVSTAKVGFGVQCPVRWGYNEVVLEARRGEKWVPFCRSVRRAAYFPVILPPPRMSYENYVEVERQRLENEWGEYVSHAEAFPQKPLVSVVMPVYRTDPGLLSKAIESVRRQIYEHWELCLVDDASGSEGVTRVLRGLENDLRIKVKVRAERGNISAATNDAIEMATGEWIAFADHDDELAADALYHVVETINRKPECDVIYTDQDKIDEQQKRWEPFFKPNWSPEYMRGVMYLGHLMVARASLVRELGGCDRRFDGVQDYELGLRLSERTSRIEHIPRVLYHWRAIAGSVAANGNAKAGIEQLQELAVQEHLQRIGIAASARRGRGHRVRLEPVKREIYPKISILIPTRDHPELIGRCLKTLFETTAYPNVEVLIGDNETRDADALEILNSHPVKKIPLAGGFHFARFNNILAAQAEGEFLLMLNNDTEIVQPDWLDQLLFYAQQEDVGAVGPVLTYADGTVQHAGIVLGPRGTADHVMRGFPSDCDGYMGSLACTREVTAVTAAALMISRRKFQLLGGLCERYQRHYDDLDFCLRLRSRGLRNLCVATARLVHHESRSRGDKYDFTDRVLLLDRWESLIDKGDEYYNPNFDRDSTDYQVGSGGLSR